MLAQSPDDTRRRTGTVQSFHMRQRRAAGQAALRPRTWRASLRSFWLFELLDWRCVRRRNRRACLLPRVTRRRGQPRVLDRYPNREVVQTLKCVSGESEDMMDRVVIEAADARTPHTSCFSLQIQRLPDDARFPEQVSIERLT